jgi:hypothetical protein
MLDRLSFQLAITNKSVASDMRCLSPTLGIVVVSVGGRNRKEIH